MSGPSPHPVLERLGARRPQDAAALRAELVPSLRDILDSGRAAAEEQLLREGDGVACARHLSCLMDGALQIIHEAVVQHLYPAHNPSSSERLAE